MNLFSRVWTIDIGRKHEICIEIQGQTTVYHEHGKSRYWHGDVRELSFLCPHE